jgi:uncharacterized RDD family membrane protein YckC
VRGARIGSLNAVADSETQDHPGQRLGLPPQGPGSLASWPRRIVALLLDWFPSLAVASLLQGMLGLTRDQAAFLPLLIFFLEVTFFTVLVGGSFGQIATRLVVARLDGRPLGLLRAAARSLLTCLVVPPVVFNRDNRGLHDLAVGTVVLNR